MRRGLVVLERDPYGELQALEVSAEIALACCARCRRRWRVLPSDVLPRKRYALALIEHELSEYAKGARSLRQVSDDLLGEKTPVHTTLHGWSEGLGAHALGRATVPTEFSVPISRLLAESEAHRPQLAPVQREEAPVDARRYRSPARRERLSAMATLFSVAALFTGLHSPHALSAWRRLAFTWSGSCALAFPSAISCTPIEHVDRHEPPTSRSASLPSTDPCPHPPKSPPGATSRSPPA